VPFERDRGDIVSVVKKLPLDVLSHVRVKLVESIEIDFIAV
jgi:hypothetical protein